jgi:GNAT superfamily N-acetyltransferase
MLLDAETLAWLREHVPGPVAERDLADAYGFRHPLNARQELADAELPGWAFAWAIWLYGPHEGPVLLYPLERRIHPDIFLHSDESTGLVVQNEVFIVLAEFRRQGLATAVYAAEEALYRRWGVREIHPRS